MNIDGDIHYANKVFKVRGQTSRSCVYAIMVEEYISTVWLRGSHVLLCFPKIILFILFFCFSFILYYSILFPFCATLNSHTNYTKLNQR